MANLSVPSPGKWILEIFGKHILFDIFLGIWESIIPTFFDIFCNPGGQGAGGGALRVGCGRSAHRATGDRPAATGG